MIRIFNYKHSLFIRISVALLFLLILLGLAYVLITAYASKEYYKETTQRLNSQVASHLVHELNPFSNGQVNEESLGKIMHSMMAVNPSLEVYLLNPEGTILKYVVLDKDVRLTSVRIDPVKQFVLCDGKEYIEGDDPRNPGKSVVFSAAEVRENGLLLGYVYMVLASEEYENVSQALFGSYFMRIGITSFVFTLIAAFILGLLLIRILTRSLRELQVGVRAFESGNLHARIPVNGHGEIADLANLFNKMADTILVNIEELKAVDSLRRDLIANVSHDLRSPMAVIHGYIETLVIKEGKLTAEERSEYLSIILKSSEKLRKLVADLFELSRLEARQIEIHKEPLFVNELLFEIVRQFELIAKEKNLVFQVRIPDKMPIMHADANLINRVFQNLLENAIKYSGNSGEIGISAAVENDNVRIVIENTGAGISAEDMPHIFDRYYKADHQKPNSGSGLGLAIVKRIIELHDAEINVYSEINRLTRFEVLIRLQA